MQEGYIPESFLKEVLKKLPIINKKFNSWDEEYASPHSLQTRFLMLWTHAPLIEAVRRFNPVDVAEVGAGEGLISTTLSWMGYKVMVIDNNRGVIDEASAYARKDGGKQTIQYGDALKVETMPEVDVYVSHGVLEHFNNDQICRIIDNMLAKSRKGVAFCVPSIWYFPWWANARHMPLSSWKRILKKYNMELRYYGELKPLTIGHKILSLLGYRNNFILGVIPKQKS
jgi:SAM-dependent methyltransferase